MNNVLNDSDTKAYIIGGHGSENDDKTFIVPDRCIVVVKVYAGSYTQGYSFLEKSLCSLSPDILKNPIDHYDDLKHVLGSIAIYKPDDLCPNFLYTLMQCYQHSGIYWSSCNSFGSGVMDVDSIYDDKERIQCMRNLTSSNRSLKSKIDFMAVDNPEVLNHNSVYDSIYPYLEKLYQHSVYPTTDDIEEYVHEAIEDGANSFSDILTELEDKLHTTQKELCEYPGVYYHIICRANPVGKNLFELNSEHQLYRIPPQVTFVSSNQHRRNLLKTHISEAELYRKPYIKRMYEKRSSENRTNVAKGGKAHFRRKTVHNKRSKKNHKKNQTKKKDRS
jgi:hypothetical protein